VKHPATPIFAAFAGAALMAMAAPLAADDSSQPKRTMVLTGHGEVTSEPDLATVTLGVVREAKTARAALSANNQAMAEVISAVTGAGIAQKDVQTSNFSVSPKYHYPKQKSTGEQPAPRIVGYTVSNSVTVTIRDLDKLGEVLDSVVSAGSNQINGVTFSIAEPKPLRNEARKLATQDAIAKAELFAEAARVELGPIISISEHFIHVPPPQPKYARTMAMEAADAVPIARGEHEISAQVNMTWEIR
jgi:uncharacterized protein YggE